MGGLQLNWRTDKTPFCGCGASTRSNNSSDMLVACDWSDLRRHRQCHSRHSPVDGVLALEQWGFLPADQYSPRASAAANCLRGPRFLQRPRSGQAHLLRSQSPDGSRTASFFGRRGEIRTHLHRSQTRFSRCSTSGAVGRASSPHDLAAAFAKVREKTV
jgi:hypothetical protein